MSQEVYVEEYMSIQFCEWYQCFQSDRTLIGDDEKGG